MPADDLGLLLEDESPPKRLARLRAVLPYLFTAALFVAGLYALYHLLKPVDLREVVLQVRATPSWVIGMALAATFGGYISLVGYDWSALRYIGKRLPMPVIVAGGFMGYAFGNTIGLSAVSGGAVRYRIYSSLGLTGYDIARISTFAALSYGFGATVIGLVAVVFHPHALENVISVDPGTLRLVALAAALALCTLLAVLAFRRSGLTVRGVRVEAPSPGIVGAQLVFTFIDFTLAALTLYVLLPANDMGFVTFLAVYSAATMTGVASHVPGGIGVFESVVIAAMPPEVPIDQAAAALLLYRLIYFLVPFLVALVLLALLELRVAAGLLRSPRFAPLEPVARAVSALVPIAMAAMTFASGLYMLFSSVIPASTDFSEHLEVLVPLGFVESGALLSSAIGAVLIIVAHGLVRRAAGAYWLAAGALLAGALASLSHGLDYDRAILMMLGLLILLPCRREFYRTTRLTQDALSRDWVMMVGLALISAAFLFFFANKSTPYANELWWQFAANEQAPRAMRSGLLGSLALVVFLLVYALRPSRLSTEPASIVDLARAAPIVAGQESPEGNYVFTGDKSVLFSSSGRSFLMYRAHGRTWVALGDPVGEPAEAPQLAWQFHDAANAANARPVFYEVSTRNLPLWVEMGMAVHKMGEEAVVPLAGFGLEGGTRKRLRTTYNRALRDGLSFELVEPPHAAALIEELRGISDAWLAAKKSREKQFSVGRYNSDYIARFPLALVRLEGRIVAFANVLTTEVRDRATIDLMRHLPEAPGGTMEFLFTALMLELKGRGHREFSLGMSPLSGLETRRGTRWTSKLGSLVYRHGGHFYNFEGLRRFKDKFDPEWRPRFLVSPPRTPVLMIAADISMMISGGRAQARQRGEAAVAPLADPQEPAPPARR